MLETLLDLDRDLFIALNSGVSNSLFDSIMPIWTDLHKEPLFWIVVLGFIAFQIFRRPFLSTTYKTRVRSWLLGLLILGLSMATADLVAYRGVKTWVQRDRPEAAGVEVILRTPSHSGWSFPSNHAANNFALARTVQILAPAWTFPAYAFAFGVAFSRVYVGVHYPLDVTFGALIGFLSASLVSLIFRRVRPQWFNQIKP